MLIPHSLIQGLGGYAYHCPDMIGGGEYMSFKEKEGRLDEELVVRYAQAAALCPMMQFSAAPWRVLSQENMEIVKKAAQLHCRFGNYICTLAEEAAHSGEPIMRHMAYEYPEQGFETVNDQFMLGSKILAAPVLVKGQRSRKVKLPEGRWKGADGVIYEGGHTITIDAPLEQLPWFEAVTD